MSYVDTFARNEVKRIKKDLGERKKIKPSCDTRFQRAFTAYVCVFKVVILIGANQCNFSENANVCRKRTLKTRVATLRLLFTLKQRALMLLPRKVLNITFSLLLLKKKAQEILRHKNRAHRK